MNIIVVNMYVKFSLYDKDRLMLHCTLIQSESLSHIDAVYFEKKKYFIREIC
jgi:hypothetical protein